MITVYKYKIVPNQNSILIPKGAEILTVQTQDNIPCIWAKVDTEAKHEERFFEIFGTGHKIHCDMGVDRKYIGTFQIDNGNFVFHLFERLN